MNENNAPLMLQVIGDVCCLMLYHADSKYNTFNMFQTVGELLCIFLNGEHVEKLAPESDAEFAASHGAIIKNEEVFREWLGNYDRERYLRIVHDIYLSEDKYVEALKPSQRLQIYLNFYQDALVTSLTEQAISQMEVTLSRTPELSAKYELESFMLLMKTGSVTLQEDFSHACQFMQEHGIDLANGTSYMFATPDELIIWLLRHVMEHDKYIKKCEFCGRYFVPKRNTKKYCSDACASKQREEDSFFGVPEFRTLYKRIVVNLTDKDARMKKLQLPYVSTADPDTWVKPKDVLKDFYNENAEYMNTLRDVYREVNVKEPDGFALIRWNTAKNYYLNFLQKQYDYATSLELDRDAYFRPD